MRLDNWALVGTGGPYAAPECRTPRLTGTLLDDHDRYVRHKLGKEIITSEIVKAEGRIVFTKSGSCYELMSPHPDYLEYLKEQGSYYNADNPLGNAFG